LIELFKTPDGLEVFRFGGRLLASRFDPRAEATQWLNARTEFIDRVKTIFVLGLGCAYHVEELLERTQARIVVLESHPEIIEASSKRAYAADSRVRVECVDSLRALRANASVREGLKASFVVLMHPSSAQSDPELIKSLREHLLGRTWGTLNWQWRLKSNKDLDGVPRVAPDTETLTIYDLDQTELVQNSEARERMLLKALRELVK
jgi:hypothetical protein